jgi:hypothetical protein
MAEYRAYVVGRDGHYLRSNAFVAADGESAIARAKQFIDVHGSSYGAASGSSRD